MNRADLVPFTVLGTAACFILMLVFAHKADAARNRQDESAQHKAKKFLKLFALLFAVFLMLNAFCMIAPQT